jgi:phage shock protein A
MTNERIDAAVRQMRDAARSAETTAGAGSGKAEASTMADKIIPLRPMSHATPALARFDVLAAKLLADGQAATLTAARVDAVLKQTREQRAKLAAVLEDLQTRPLSGNTQLDQVNADLLVGTSEGLAHIDGLIRTIEALRSDTATEDPPD